MRTNLAKPTEITTRHQQQFRQVQLRETFKNIDLREQISVNYPNSSYSIEHSRSPKVTRNLFNSGFVFKNHNSPIACDYKLSKDF